MGYAFSKHYYTLAPEETKDIKRETGFSSGQIKKLFNRFQNLDQDGRGFLTKSDFRRIKEIDLNPLGDRLMEMFFPNEAEKLFFKDFALKFAVFRPIKSSTPGYAVNSRDAKLKFLYSLMDGNEDGIVDKDDIYELLELMMGAKVDSDQLKLIADRVIDEADTNNDGCISLNEFQKVTQDLLVGVEMSFISFQ